MPSDDSQDLNDGEDRGREGGRTSLNATTNTIERERKSRCALTFVVELNVPYCTQVLNTN